MLREFIQSILKEYWSKNLDQVMEPPPPLPFDPDSDREDNDEGYYNPYDANDELDKVSATQHLKTQRAGVGMGSGPMSGRRPGGNSQGFGSGR